MIMKKSYGENEKGDLATICPFRKGVKGGDIMVGSTGCELCASNYGTFPDKKEVWCNGY